MDQPPASADDSAYLGQDVKLLREKKADLLAKWRHDARKLASAKRLDNPTLDDHIPAFLEELIKALASGQARRVAEVHTAGSPSMHGLQRLEAGFDIIEVVAEYNIIRDVLQDLVEEHGLTLHGPAFRIVNWVLDSAIGIAVENYAKQTAVELQQRREEHLAFIVHDLRTPLQALSLSSEELEEILSPLQINEAGEAMEMLKRNLGRLNVLVSRVSDEQVNLMTASGHMLVRRLIDLSPLVKSFIRDVQPLCESNGTRIINEVPGSLVIYADALLLTQIFQNLVSNALRFTPGGVVTIGATAMEGKIECWVKDDGEGIRAGRDRPHFR